MAVFLGSYFIKYVSENESAGKNLVFNKHTRLI